MKIVKLSWRAPKLSLPRFPCVVVSCDHSTLTETGVDLSS